MQGLYENYVRFGYYERRHPVRSGAVTAIVMIAFLWPATHTLRYAVVYSVVFCAFRVLFADSRSQRERFARWAARHPEPRAGNDSTAPGTAAPRPKLPQGRALLPWLGWTLIVAFAIYWVLGVLLTAVIDAQNGARGAIIAAVIAVPAAVYLRLHWPPARDWKSRP